MQAEITVVPTVRDCLSAETFYVNNLLIHVNYLNRDCFQLYISLTAIKTVFLGHQPVH